MRASGQEIARQTRRGAATAEIDRVIAEYAVDACTELCVRPSSFTERDHVWVREHAATSLDEIEKATLRLAAIRVFGTMSAAAARLGMGLPALYRWFDGRKLLGSHR